MTPPMTKMTRHTETKPETNTGITVPVPSASGYATEVSMTMLYNCFERLFNALWDNSNGMGFVNQNVKNSEIAALNMQNMFADAMLAPGENYLNVISQWCKKPDPNDWLRKLGEHVKSEFNGTLYFSGELFKGSLIVLAPGQYVPLAKLEPKVFFHPEQIMVVSNILGDYVKVKSKQGKEMGAQVSDDWFHISRFRKESLPRTILKNYIPKPMAAKSYPHKFLPGIRNRIYAFQPGMDVWSIDDNTHYKVIRSDYEKKQVLLYKVFAYQAYGGAYSHRIHDTPDVTKPLTSLRCVENLCTTTDQMDHVLRIGDDVAFAIEEFDDIMEYAGWKNTGDPTAYHFWKSKLHKLVATVIDITELGNSCILHFYETKELEGLGFSDFNFRAKADNLMYLPMDVVDELIVSKTESNIHRPKVGPTEKEILEEEDKKAGPYEDLSYLKDKIVTFNGLDDVDGKHCLVTEYNPELGRIHIKFYNNRAEKRVYMRISQKHNERMSVIGDKIYAD